MPRDYKQNCPCMGHPFECFGHPTTCLCARAQMDCLTCEETFTFGEMYPGKRYIDPLECPYCRTPWDGSAKGIPPEGT
jgi:hypothetical protein